MIMRSSFVGLLAMAVLLIAFAVEHGLTSEFDRAGLLVLSGGPAGLWRGVTRLGDSEIRIGIALLALALLLIWRRRAAAIELVAIVGGGMALNAVAKGIVTRSRPGLLPHLDKVDSFSFPSGHAAGTMMLGLALALLVAPARWRRPALGGAAIVALLLGLSRVALAVHWPTDVIAGWLEGVAWVMLVHATVPALARWRGDGR